MKALVLAAGYATRLYPLTRDFPKPLLAVGGQTILDHLLVQIQSIPEIDRVWLVSNHRFLDHFNTWLAQAKLRVQMELLDDGSTCNEDRLGAIGDIAFALRTRGIADDLLICAADNILRFPLAGLATAFRARRAPHICVRHVADLAARRRTGIAVLDEDERVVEFAEKPREPKTCWGVPPIYLYPAETLPRIAEYLGEGGTSDAPGNFVAWLTRREPVYAHRMNGTVLDIGTPEALAQARSQLAPPP